MSYSTFKAKPRAPYIRPERVTNWPSALSSRANAAIKPIATECTPQPKGEAAKPGKRAPTAAERAWMNWIVSIGCIACRLDGMPPRPTAVHHILRGGIRMGHLHTLPLCDPGHHQGGQQLGLISRHPWKQRFEQRYGTEQELLEILRKEYSAHTGCALSAIK
jgi:hypothetical protein